MTILEKLSDKELLTATKHAVCCEGESTTTVLRHLQEVEHRRLYSDLGFSSLFAYAVKKLENKTCREAEKILLADSPAPKSREQVKFVAEDTVEIRFTAPAEISEKINELKALLAHSHPQASLVELFTLLLEQGIDHFRKKRACATAKAKKAPVAPKAHFQTASQAHQRTAPKAQERYVSAALKREIWRQEKCANCGGKYALEIDHEIPFAKGGATSLANLRILCRSCNQRAAIKEFGQGKMATFPS